MLNMRGIDRRSRLPFSKLHMTPFVIGRFATSLAVRSIGTVESAPPNLAPL